MNRPKLALRFLAPALVLAALLAGCGDGSKNGGLNASLYAVDSASGKVFEVDTAAKLAATIPTLTVKSSSGEVVFQGSKGFVAVGNDTKNTPGLYTFDTANPSAGASLVSPSISAQYICIVSPTVGYVTSSDFYGTYTDGLYVFDPSSPSTALVRVDATLSHPQDVVQGPDSRIYVAENGTGKVARINPAAGTPLEAEISCAKAGATGLLAGSYNSADGVFVVSTGSWGTSSYENGSIEFVPVGATTGSTATSVLSTLTFTASRLAAFSPTKLVATGYGATFIVDLSGPAASPVLSGTTPFGSYDVNIIAGVAYVPDGGNKIYGFGPDGVVTSVIAVGASNDMVTNVGVPAN